MPQTSPAQRAEAARLLADVGKGHGDYWDEQRLLELLPALLADAEALVEIEPWSRLYGLTPDDTNPADICPCPRCGAMHPVGRGR